MCPPQEESAWRPSVALSAPLSNWRRPIKPLLFRLHVCGLRVCVPRTGNESPAHRAQFLAEPLQPPALGSPGLAEPASSTTHRFLSRRWRQRVLGVQAGGWPRPCGMSLSNSAPALSVTQGLEKAEALAQPDLGVWPEITFDKAPCTALHQHSADC